MLLISSIKYLPYEGEYKKKKYMFHPEGLLSFIPVIFKFPCNIYVYINPRVIKVNKQIEILSQYLSNQHNPYSSIYYVYLQLSILTSSHLYLGKPSM